MSDRPVPPYPAETAAKGWRFELDPDRIEQSDTWPLAAEVPMCQAALLMMWLVSWRQVPCGSLPSDDDVLRSKLRIPPAQWPRMRPILMRGWWQASDGRLYHRTLTARVEEMLSKRRSDADRQAARRMRQERESQGSTEESRVTPTESSTDHGPLNNEKPPNPRRRGQELESPPGFDRFWHAYPKKEAKKDATKAFAKLRPDEELLSLMLAAITKQACSEQWRKDGGQFIPMPSSWLNGRRWEDAQVALPLPFCDGQDDVERTRALLAEQAAAAARAVPPPPNLLRGRGGNP
jgi:uncharacterized protein YdaU (DUF1376 family)